MCNKIEPIQKSTSKSNFSSSSSCPIGDLGIVAAIDGERRGSNPFEPCQDLDSDEIGQEELAIAQPEVVMKPK